MEKIITYFNKLNETFSINLENVPLEFDEELIHDLRVSVKKIKASFFFLKVSIPKFKAKKNYFHYREVFQRLGAIRDLQIQQKKFTDWSDKFGINFTYYLKFLKTSEHTHQQKFIHFFNNIPWHQYQKVAHKITVAVPEADLCKTATDYLSRKIAIIQSFEISKVNTYEEIHDLRKNLKELQYNLNLFENCIFKRKLFKSYFKKLKDLTEELGNWHDNYNLLSYLFSYKLNFFRTKTSQLRKINTFEKELIRLNRIQMDNIQKQFNAFSLICPKIEKFWKNECLKQR